MDRKTAASCRSSARRDFLLKLESYASTNGKTSIWFPVSDELLDLNFFPLFRLCGVGLNDFDFSKGTFSQLLSKPFVT